ncbi:GNAT family N-acetyltransferase [Burkholderia cenocepacia]|uniref:GNAT family N-acetyltransferase n=1 Tax=Burkholderia cenocepacia TaxID=95486 RepID=UPI001E4F82B2|nr:GNAT family N-acetyltransferase [Burkholderia cenocepacia]
MRSIAVNEHVRRAGVGRMLVARLLEQCRARAVRSVGLLTTTAEDYFAGQGFVRVAREDVPEPLLASSQFQGVCPDLSDISRPRSSLMPCFQGCTGNHQR